MNNLYAIRRPLSYRQCVFEQQQLLRVVRPYSRIPARLALRRSAGFDGDTFILPGFFVAPLDVEERGLPFARCGGEDAGDVSEFLR